MKRFQTIAEALGFALLVAGVAMVFIPAAVILAGVVLVLVGNVAVVKSKARR